MNGVNSQAWQDKPWESEHETDRESVKDHRELKLNAKSPQRAAVTRDGLFLREGWMDSRMERWILSLLRALQNFETAVRENVTINGQPWEEASDDSRNYVCLSLSDSNIQILEDEFDELIVETATRRKQWPKKILVHAIQTMKAEQEMLKLYQPVVKPADIRPQPSQGKDFVGRAASIPALIEKAEGFSQALTLQPALELCKLRQEVFSGFKVKEENDVQNSVPPGEVTPTGTVCSKNPYVLLKRRKAAGSPERKRYPLRRRKITLSA
uniref:NSL1 component of MIS12 kinetochore complex n=1 Tax=Serinus canaria TaxID=9135 RepID=A0A8C9MS38_SERCA